MDERGALDLGRFEVLTFDCYGTLIDWERGLLDAMRPILADAGTGAPGDPDAPSNDALLERFALHEAALEAGPYQPYRAVLAAALRRVAAELGVHPTDAQLAASAASVADWPPFTDSVDALRWLAGRYRLGVITNCDDDLFAASADRLGNPFTWVVTAEQVRAYKPSLVPFERAIAVIGVSPDRVLHVAQSLYHDHLPARRLGLATAWVNRRHGRPGFGATPPAEGTADLVVPDLAELAQLAAQ